MLKLPKTLPSLESPHFILATPEWLQLSVLFLMGSSSLTALLWVGSLLLDGRAESAHYAVLAIMALVGVGALYPRNWRRWVNFAADRRGIYLSTFSGLFVHVPWPDVGPSTIGIAGIGSNRQRTVILPLRADDEVWTAILGGRKRRVNAQADADGFRPFGIGNATRRVEDTQQRIETIRQIFR